MPKRRKRATNLPTMSEKGGKKKSPTLSLGFFRNFVSLINNSVISMSVTKRNLATYICNLLDFSYCRNDDRILSLQLISSPQIIFLRRLHTQQVFHKIIPTATHHVRIVRTKTMCAVREQYQIIIFIRFIQSINH